MHRYLLIFGLAILSWLGSTEPVKAQYNNWALGFRLGEPAGVNIRKYFGNNKAFDVNIGTYGGLYANRRDYLRGRYQSVGVSLQGHYLFHDRLFGKESLLGYYGIGGQVNSRRYHPDRLGSTPEGYINQVSLGGSGIAGAEYFIPNKPLSVFIEAGLYIEVLPSPFFFNVQSGVGLRFNL